MLNAGHPEPSITKEDHLSARGRSDADLASYAKQAGLSKLQWGTARQVVNVSLADFEKQVESDTPPAIANLGELSMKENQLLQFEPILLPITCPFQFSRKREQLSKVDLEL